MSEIVLSDKKTPAGEMKEDGAPIGVATATVPAGEDAAPDGMAADEGKTRGKCTTQSRKKHSDDLEEDSAPSAEMQEMILADEREEDGAPIRVATATVPAGEDAAPTEIAANKGKTSGKRTTQSRKKYSDEPEEDGAPIPETQEMILADEREEDGAPIGVATATVPAGEDATPNGMAANKGKTSGKRTTQSRKKYSDEPEEYGAPIPETQEMILADEPEEYGAPIPETHEMILADEREEDGTPIVEEGDKNKASRKRATQSRKKHYTEDSIRLYLQEIGRIRLLRADEEIELARKIADLLELERIRDQIADLNDIADPEDVSDAEWAAKVDMNLVDFRRRLLQGRRAKDKMVQSNLRLVVSIAKKYMNRGLSFQDLIQEGSLGLIRAAEKFDHEKGYKFSTYATWWIRQAITRAIADQSRTIRLPVHLYETISRIKKTTKLLSQEMGRKPTEEEIADRMEMTIEKLRFIAKSAQLPISLETPIGKEEDSRLGDFIESDGETPDDQVAKNLLREDLESVLGTLSPRERDVLKLRYGLDDGRMKTLEEIGQIFNVTRERIRQIEAKALRKLRHPNRNSVLKEYIR